jgi:hypothetical protein
LLGSFPAGALAARAAGSAEYGDGYKSRSVEFYLERSNHVLIVEFDGALVRLKAELAKYLNFHTIVRKDNGEDWWRKAI